MEERSIEGVKRRRVGGGKDQLDRGRGGGKGLRELG